MTFDTTFNQISSSTLAMGRALRTGMAFISESTSKVVNLSKPLLTREEDKENPLEYYDAISAEDYKRMKTFLQIHPEKILKANNERAKLQSALKHLNSEIDSLEKEMVTKGETKKLDTTHFLKLQCRYNLNKMIEIFDYILAPE